MYDVTIKVYGKSIVVRGVAAVSADAAWLFVQGKLEAKFGKLSYSSKAYVIAVAKV